VVRALWYVVQTVGEGVRAVTGAGSATRPLVAVAAMVALAALDLVGAVLAKHWSDHRSLVSLAGGMLVFVLLFLVYGSSLAYAELTTVTFGWIVMLQLGVVVLQRLQDGRPIGTDRVLAMTAMLALQAYLVLAPSAEG
jgi:hypothetical protein